MTPELHRNPDAAAEMAANAVLRYMRDCQMGTESERQAWLEKVFALIAARRRQAN